MHSGCAAAAAAALAAPAVPSPRPTPPPSHCRRALLQARVYPQLHERTGVGPAHHRRQPPPAAVGCGRGAGQASRRVLPPQRLHLMLSPRHAPLRSLHAAAARGAGSADALVPRSSSGGPGSGLAGHHPVQQGAAGEGALGHAHQRGRGPAGGAAHGGSGTALPAGAARMLTAEPASRRSCHRACLPASVQLPDAPWGIISIKAQAEDYETPMQVRGGGALQRRRGAGGRGRRACARCVKAPPAPRPAPLCHLPLQPITMMRNALGWEEGGSGVALDRAKYEASTAYWEAHAAIQ